MFIYSSEGGLGLTSHLWFNVDIVGSLFYQFWYYSYGDGTAKLSTTYEGSTDVSVINIGNKDQWFKTLCYPLPVDFVGQIYIIAEHGGGVDEDIAVDNIQLLTSCSGKFSAGTHLNKVV